MSEDLTTRKIYPRNLTARAEKWVRGNPITVRPESGVDNSFPGLEFDQRNLDKKFFPGLEFEFHTSLPPILRSVDDARAGRALPIDQSDTGEIFPETIYLWAVFGTFGTMVGPQQRVERFSLQDSTGGLEAWRVVHDLEPESVAVLLAPRSAEGGIALDAAAQLEAENALQGGTDLVRRDETNRLVFAVLSGQRANYLLDGVINPDLYEPGDLSRSLCSPWQYDFTDCGCFYWASNKPDLVALEAEGPQVYNFQRAQRGPGQERPVDEILADRNGLLTMPTREKPIGWSTRDPNIPGHVMNYQALLNNWEELSPIFGAAESNAYVPEPIAQLRPEDVLPRDEVLHRLRYLATVEHGLMVEYLYAYYSIDAPRTIPGTDLDTARKFDIARSVLSVAIDEMRHFRWVNEILRELGQPMELGRIGLFEDLDDDNRFIAHEFALKSLTLDQLDWFIDVERPSDQVDPDRAADTVDGLYTRILLSIRQGTEFTDNEHAKLLHLIKLIIDEGLDHFTRFSNVKAVLDGVAPQSWLRTSFPEHPEPLADGHPAKVAEIVADRAYGTVLSTLGIVFSMSNSATGDFLQAARFAMYALDDAAHEVIALGGAPLFTVPEDDTFIAGLAPAAGDVPPEDRLRETLIAPMESELEELRQSGSRAVAESMEAHYARMISEMARLM